MSSQGLYNQQLHSNRCMNPGGTAVDDSIYELMAQEKRKLEAAAVMAANEKSGQFGLTLSEGEATELVQYRNESLRAWQRVEFGQGILEKLINTFCDSKYINQSDYLQTLEQLQDIFYEFKNEAQDLLTDDELLTFMKEQYEGVCCGDLEYLEGTCLVKFTQVIRAGYRGFQESGGSGEYEQIDEVPRWDKELYMQAVRELFWE